MVVSGVDHALIEFCRAFGNDGHGGGVGLWAYTTRNVTFQYCIASGTTTNNGGDGGGFDLDGACVNCTFQSCLSYGNDGPGYMHGDYPSASLTEGNVIRDSVSVNDERKAKGGPYGFGFCTWGSGLDACTISNNLTIVTTSDPQARQNSAYWVSYIPESDQNAQYDHGRQHLSGCVFRGNTALVTGPGVAYATNDMPDAATRNVLFAGNSFLSSREFAPLLWQGKQRFATVNAWRSATGQETSDGSTRPALPANFRPDRAPTLAATLSSITDPGHLPKLDIIQVLASARP